MKKRMKRMVSLLLAGAVVISGLNVLPALNNVQAAESTEAQMMISGQQVTVGNSYINRVFDISGQHLTTKGIQNKRAGLDFEPAEGSEEFIIKLSGRSQKHPGEINREKWDAEASDQNSDVIGSADGPGSNLIDGDESTIWHSKYSVAVPYPHFVIFDMKKTETIAAFSYLPRQDTSTNGDIGEYELYVADTKAELDNAASLAASGTFVYNDRGSIYVNLPQAKTGRYVKLKAVSPKTAGQIWATGAEVKMYSEKVGSGTGAGDSYQRSDVGCGAYYKKGNQYRDFSRISL